MWKQEGGDIMIPFSSDLLALNVLFFLFIIPPKPQPGRFFVLTVLDTNEFPCVNCCLGLGLEEIVDRTRYLELSPFWRRICKLDFGCAVRLDENDKMNCWDALPSIIMHA
jgi:hypothetical protein